MRIFFNLALRHFLKSKGLNSLNVIGLSMGLIAATLIILYADHEFTYDRFHTDAENIYRMEARTNGDNWFSNVGVEHSRELLAGSYPEVKNIVLLNPGQSSFLNYKGKKFAEKNILRTSPGSAFFELFDFKILEGNPENLLEAPHAVVLTQSAAERYFEGNQAIGETLELDTILLKVTGIIEDLPTNSHLKFEVLFTSPGLYSRDHFHSQGYLQLVKDATPTQLEQKILDMEGVARDEFHELSEVRLMPLPDIYLKSDTAFGSGGQGDQLQLIVFLVIGGLILLISIANYINLSFAIYLSKGREIGVRKVFGETKSQIIQSFAFEAFLTTFLTVPLVLSGVFLILPVFNDLLGISLENKLVSSPIYAVSAFGLIVLISIMTVIYPATTLANAETGLLMKSKSVMNVTGGTGYRNVLIFVQFVLLFTLGISSWFMNRQIGYLDSKDMGFDVTGVIKISNAWEIGEFSNYELFKTKLLSYPQISGVAFGPMMGDNMNPLAYKPEGHDEIYENLLSYGVDIDYFDVMGMDLTHGDFKSALLASEAGQIVSLVNHSFIERYGWTDDPIGKKIVLRPGTENELNRKVSGVFKDFHFFTLKEKITPQIISLRPDPQFVNTNILIRSTSPENLEETISIIENQWYDIQPNVPLEYDLMGEAVKALYEKERQTSQISLTFSLLAIVLSLLGLIGFMIYIIGLKSKEITVRKVLGATLLQIIGVLNRKLFINILVAAVAGSALSYWLVSRWLQDYAYTISIEPIVFVAALVLVYATVFIITTVRSLQWARTNPVTTLNNE
ncbi:MAG: ABC transporter permease [Cyclobacteriaceae bacterium]